MKVGLDDYLVNHSIDDFMKLPRIEPTIEFKPRPKINP